MSWYHIAKKQEQLPWKVLVYDNYSKKGVHTPSLFQNQWVNASSEHQAWVIVTKTWPINLLERINEYKQRHITVKLVVDEEEQKRRESLKKKDEDDIQGMWWNQ